MKIKLFIAAALAATAFSSCSDVFDTKSDRLVYDPDLNEKTDSMFYTLGALKGVQQAIDQYVLTNELRGDLTAVTDAASADLKELASFQVSSTNRYDSAAVYYRIINNCNYYIAHRDTTLTISGKKVTTSEYAEAFAMRAWAYMQLAKTYGSVPFYTEPLTDIASIEHVNNAPRKNLQAICDALAPDLIKYSGTAVPSYGTFEVGSSSQTGTKNVTSSMMMLPVDLVLGDLYLETNQYAQAAKYYFTYLRDNSKYNNVSGPRVRNYQASWQFSNTIEYEKVPAALRRGAQTAEESTSGSWSIIFTSTHADVITYIPFATNRLRGTTTALPALFGYNYYSTESGDSYNKDLSIEPSSVYKELSSNQDYHYMVTENGKEVFYSTPMGDMRLGNVTQNGYVNNERVSSISKFNTADVPLYRAATVYLRLAEAINRMGHPNVAFAILKDGISKDLELATYITPEDLEFLRTEVPFLSTENLPRFDYTNSSNTRLYHNTGIHGRGCGYVSGPNSLYTYSDELKKKFAELHTLGYAIADTTKADTINAVENLICDEMALESAFEGSRFGDLCRLARHKNADNPYAPGSFGSQWLANKLAFKNPKVDLKDENNWYLPFR